MTNRKTREAMRKLTLDGVEYGWRVTHRHLQSRKDPEDFDCVDKLMAFKRGTTGAALEIFFPAGESGGPEYVRNHGVVCWYRSDLVINLHRPHTVAMLLRAAIEQGWSAAAPMRIDDGFAWVDALSEEARAALADTP